MNVLSGIVALHDAGYIPRDIDPSNIMITEDGHIRLIDFGIAKQGKKAELMIYQKAKFSVKLIISKNK